jgi:hypothetical protein
LPRGYITPERQSDARAAQLCYDSVPADQPGEYATTGIPPVVYDRRVWEMLGYITNAGPLGRLGMPRGLLNRWEPTVACIECYLAERDVFGRDGWNAESLVVLQSGGVTMLEIAFDADS